MCEKTHNNNNELFSKQWFNEILELDEIKLVNKITPQMVYNALIEHITNQNTLKLFNDFGWDDGHGWESILKFLENLTENQLKVIYEDTIKNHLDLKEIKLISKRPLTIQHLSGDHYGIVNKEGVPLFTRGIAELGTLFPTYFKISFPTEEMMDYLDTNHVKYRINKKNIILIPKNQYNILPGRLNMSDYLGLEGDLDEIKFINKVTAEMVIKEFAELYAPTRWNERDQKIADQMWDKLKSWGFETKQGGAEFFIMKSSQDKLNELWKILQSSPIDEIKIIPQNPLFNKYNQFLSELQDLKDTYGNTNKWINQIKLWLKPLTYLKPKDGKPWTKEEIEGSFNYAKRQLKQIIKNYYSEKRIGDGRHGKWATGADVGLIKLKQVYEKYFHEEILSEIKFINKITPEMVIKAWSTQHYSDNFKKSYNIRLQVIKKLTEFGFSSENAITVIKFIEGLNPQQLKEIWTILQQPINESKLPKESRSQIVKKFIQYCKTTLEITSPVKIKLTSDKADTETYAHYDPNVNQVVVYTKNRSLGDILRSLCHELVHAKQHEDQRLTNDSGTTGSDIENEANSKAGIILRDFGSKNPMIFEIKFVNRVTREMVMDLWNKKIMKLNTIDYTSVRDKLGSFGYNYRAIFFSEWTRRLSQEQLNTVYNLFLTYENKSINEIKFINQITPDIINGLYNNLLKDDSFDIGDFLEKTMAMGFKKTEIFFRRWLLTLNQNELNQVYRYLQNPVKLDEIKIIPQFKINMPEQWKEKTVTVVDGWSPFMDDFIEANKAIFDFASKELGEPVEDYIKYIYKATQESYQSTPNLEGCALIQELLYYYMQEKYPQNLEEWVPFKNRIVKMYQNGTINIGQLVNNKLEEIKFINKITPEMAFEEYIKQWSSTNYDDMDREMNSILKKYGYNLGLSDKNNEKGWFKTLPQDQLSRIYGELVAFNKKWNVIEEIKFINKVTPEMVWHEFAKDWSHIDIHDVNLGAEMDKILGTKYGYDATRDDFHQMIGNMTPEQLGNIYADILAFNKKHNINEIKIVPQFKWPSSDDIKYVEGQWLKNTEYSGKDTFMYGYQLGNYFTFRPHGGQEKVFLFPMNYIKLTGESYKKADRQDIEFLKDLIQQNKYEIIK